MDNPNLKWYFCRGEGTSLEVVINVNKIDMIKIVATSDLHGFLPEVEACDILIIAGDLTPKPLDGDPRSQRLWIDSDFMPWVESLACRHVVVVPGNHDQFMETLFPDVSCSYPIVEPLPRVVPLCNSYVEILGVKFYGAPALTSARSRGSFCLDSMSLSSVLRNMPQSLDFLVTHNAPYGVEALGYSRRKQLDKGSRELTRAIAIRNIKYHICGHAHEGNHKRVEWNGTVFYNVSYCDGDKKPKHAPIVVEI